MKQFDFNQVGKQMPYSVPDGFFDQLEADVMQEVTKETAQPKNHKKALRIALRAALAIAAAIALFFVIQPLLPKGDTDSFDSVQLAYNNLSQEDKEFLTEIYEEDEFMDNITNTEEYEENI